VSLLFAWLNLLALTIKLCKNTVKTSAMLTVGKATAPEFQPQFAAFHPRDSNHCCHGALPRDGLSLAILMALIEAWEGKMREI